MIFTKAITEYSQWKSLNVKGRTVSSYVLYLRQLALFVHNKHLEEVELEDIMEYFNLMKETGYENNSLIPRAACYKKFFEYHYNRGRDVLNFNLIPIPQKEYTKAKVATDDDFNKLLKTIPMNNDPRNIRNKALIRILHDTGARIGEVLSLDIYDLGDRRAIIKTEKSQGRAPQREIFWTKATQESLDAWLSKRSELGIKDELAVFIQCCGARVGQRFTNKGAGEMLRKLSHRAGIEVVNAHSFRHKLGHDLAKEGANNAVISNLLGHSSLQSSYVYTRLNDVEKEQVYRRFRGH